MNFKFKYLKIGRVIRPVINVRLSNGNKKFGYLALVDSGADFSVFHSSIAALLDIEIRSNDTVVFSGAGKNSVLEGKTGIVTMEVMGSGQTHKFETTSVFTGDIPENGYGLLGQRGFFDAFNEVAFSIKRGLVILKT